MKIKLDKVYVCVCEHKHKVKSVLQAKMNFCYSCGRPIDVVKVNALLEEHKQEKANATI